MSDLIKAEILKNLLKSLFYQQSEKSTITGYKMFSLNGSNPSVQHLFQLPANDSNSHRASTSSETRPFVNFDHLSMPPPPPPPSAKGPISSQFDKTVVIGKERECQLCDRAYKNIRHQKLYREQNICCICRLKFPDEPALIQHVHQTLKANICCVCNSALSDNPETNEYHFKQHAKK